VLNAYLTQVSALLQNPNAPSTLYTTATLTQAINDARSQIAGEGQCIRFVGALTSNTDQQSYVFSAITGLPAGVAGVLNVRMVAWGLEFGQKFIDAYPWEWFFRYYLSVPTFTTGIPSVWAQQGQGVSGTLWFSPAPSGVNNIVLDCVGYPLALSDDEDPEAIPYPWTDCVQYLAAYLALLGAQSTARQGDADRMFARYTEFSVRARNMSTPTVLPTNYQRSGIVPPGTAALAAQQRGG
jgi:hypothetical protein